MKNIILLIAVMVLSACATTSTKPVKELTLREKVVGEYEDKLDGNTGRLVLLDNGIVEGYINGKKRSEGKWKLTKDGEIHVTDSDGDILVCRINKDGSITSIARILKDGKRRDDPKQRQDTFKKIK